MHSYVCLVLLALCLVASDYTAIANAVEVEKVEDIQSEVSVTKPITKAVPEPPLEKPLAVKDVKAPAAHIYGHELAAEDAGPPEKDGLADNTEEIRESAAVVTPTTTTASNAKVAQGEEILTAEGSGSVSERQNPSHNTPPITGREPGTPDHSLTKGGQKVQNSQLEEVKTTTTAVPVPPPKPPVKGKEKPGNDKTLSEHQTELEGNADEGTKNAGPTVSKGPPSTGLQTITQPKGKDEDHSNGDREGTIQGGVNPQQVAAASTTTTTANKTSPKLPAPITDDVLTPALQAKGSSKASTGVQNPVTPIKPADPTESQKQIGAKATTTTTTKPAAVNTETGAALTTATITTEKQTVSTDASTTSTVASTTTLPKGFNIPQSFDKTDGSSSISLLIAFATVVTFTVTSAALVY